MSDEALQARIEQLKALPWADIKEAAELVGVEKPDGVAWKDMADEIALAEFTQPETPAETPVETPEVLTTEELSDIADELTPAEEVPAEPTISFTPEQLVEAVADVLPEDVAVEVATETLEKLNVYSTELYSNIGLPVCGVCHEKHRHDSKRNPICPINSPQCPRLRK